MSVSRAAFEEMRCIMEMLRDWLLHKRNVVIIFWPHACFFLTVDLKIVVLPCDITRIKTRLRNYWNDVCLKKP